MNLIICPNDVWLQTTLYYNSFIKLYQSIVAEYCPEYPGANPLHCPNEELYITKALDSLEHAKFKDSMVQQIKHLFTSYPTQYRMSLTPGTLEGYSIIREYVKNIVVVCPGDQRLIEPSIQHHAIDSMMYVEYVDQITPDLFPALLSRYKFTYADTMFVGSSPARELNAAISGAMNVSRVYIPDYILYEEPLFTNIPTFDNFFTFADALTRV